MLSLVFELIIIMVSLSVLHLDLVLVHMVSDRVKKKEEEKKDDLDADYT